MNYYQGDIVLVNLNPIAGHEQGNLRPALVINANPIIGHLNIVLPITSTPAKFLFSIPLDSRTKTQGNILCYQIRTVDLNDPRRQAKFLEKAPSDIVDSCVDSIQRLIGVF